jgi:hypothetical protein
MALSGAAYLFWVLVAGVSRDLMQEFIGAAANKNLQLPDLTRNVKIFFVDTGFAIDLAGLAWLGLSLLLVGLANRQRISISWAWASAIVQTMVAGLGAVLVGWAVFLPFTPVGEVGDQSTMEQVSRISLPVVLAVAVFVWAGVLMWLIRDSRRLHRRGPTLSDGLRSNVIGRK